MHHPRLSALLLCTAALPAGAELDFLLHRYTVTPDPGLTRLEVEACFDEVLPDRLVAGHYSAMRYLRAARVSLNGREHRLQARNGVLPLPPGIDGRCLRYAVDLVRLVAEARSFNSGLRTENALVAANGLWLWRPPRLDAASDIQLRFQLPEGMRVSGPWTPAAAGTVPGAVFRTGRTPPDWPGSLVLGRFAADEFQVAGTRYHIALLDGPAAAGMDRVRPWLRRAAEAAAQLGEGLPVERVQLLVVPHHAGNDAAPFATTARGGGAAVHIAFNSRAGEAVLRRDWIAVHELAHFHLPFVDRRDAWLSEGFASYYQNILPVRAGQWRPEAGWAGLLDGLRRGDHNTDTALTLRQAAWCMFSCGQTWRVYWSGAALWLMADVELRRASGGVRSLDSVLADFAACCRHPDRTWRATELLAELDRIAGTRVFTRLYENHIDSRFFPNLRNLLAELGLRQRGGHVQLDAAAPLAPIRDAIMQARPAREKKKTTTEDTKDTEGRQAMTGFSQDPFEESLINCCLQLSRASSGVPAKPHSPKTLSLLSSVSFVVLSSQTFRAEISEATAAGSPPSQTRRQSPGAVPSSKEPGVSQRYSSR